MALIELIIIIAVLFITPLLCILLIPFYFSFSFTKEGHDIKTEFEVSWLWGLIKKKFEGRDTEKAGKEKVEKPEKEKKRRIDQFKDAGGAMEYIPAFFELVHPFLKFAKDALFSLLNRLSKRLMSASSIII